MSFNKKNRWSVLTIYWVFDKWWSQINWHKKTASCNWQWVLIASRIAGGCVRARSSTTSSKMMTGRRRDPVFITSRGRRAEDSRMFYRLDGARWSKPTGMTVQPSTCYGEQRTAPGRMRYTGRLVRYDQTMRNGSRRANACAAVARKRSALTNVTSTCVFRWTSGRRESSRTFYAPPAVYRVMRWLNKIHRRRMVFIRINCFKLFLLHSRRIFQ